MACALESGYGERGVGGGSATPVGGEERQRDSGIYIGGEEMATGLYVEGREEAVARFSRAERRQSAEETRSPFEKTQLSVVSARRARTT